MTPAGFRFLLILEIVLSLGVAVILFASDDGSLRSAAANGAPASLLASLPKWVDACVTFLLLVTLMGGFVGMYRFKRWGRTLFLLGAVCDVVLPLVDGVSVFHSGVDESTHTMFLLLSGALLALAYYSPLSARFVPTPR